MSGRKAEIDEKLRTAGEFLKELFPPRSGLGFCLTVLGGTQEDGSGYYPTMLPPEPMRGSLPEILRNVAEDVEEMMAPGFGAEPRADRTVIDVRHLSDIIEKAAAGDGPESTLLKELVEAQGRSNADACLLCGQRKKGMYAAIWQLSPGQQKALGRKEPVVYTLCPGCFERPDKAEAAEIEIERRLKENLISLPAGGGKTHRAGHPTGERWTCPRCHDRKFICVHCDRSLDECRCPDNGARNPGSCPECGGI